jgi:hypothetical protein
MVSYPKRRNCYEGGLELDAGKNIWRKGIIAY